VIWRGRGEGCWLLLLLLRVRGCDSGRGGAGTYIGRSSDSRRRGTVVVVGVGRLMTDDSAV